MAQGLAFVAYREPTNDRAVKALLQSNSNVYRTSDFTESGFVFAPFDDSKEPILLPSAYCKEISCDFRIVEDENYPVEKSQPKTTSSEEKEVHLRLVQKGIESIMKGDLKKVVLSRREEVPLENPDAIGIFKQLLNKYPTAYVYVWFHPEIGLWLGATPETLLQVERNRFKTMALAGTQKFAGSMEVKWGEKEQEEQQFVTDAILENLKESVSNIKTHGPYTTRAGALLHLRTDISGEIISKEENSVQENPHSSGNLKELIYSVHPTPAICGLPKGPAKQFILENENYDREFYTGFLGELNMKKKIQRSGNRRNTENLAYGSTLTQTSLFVNLRCMKLEENRALLFVGGGITKESDPVAEWEETQNKAETMKAVLITH
ncbi:MAG: chorismate-binding protein [Gillisia sp.]